MMTVFREAKITWADKEYTFTPSNRLIRRIEREVPLMWVQMQFASQNVPISSIAYIATEVMRAAGADVSEDEMFAELTHADPAISVRFATDILNMLMPQEPGEKKLQAKPQEESEDPA